jgi:hypothetical protein
MIHRTHRLPTTDQASAREGELDAMTVIVGFHALNGRRNGQLHGRERRFVSPPLAISRYGESDQ